MTLTFSILSIAALGLVGCLATSRWYWKQMYLSSQEYIQGLDSILDQLLN